MSGPFESQSNAIVHVQVAHPPGTTYDADGNPIPPPDDSGMSGQRVEDEQP
jgi:hypothetical protein